VLIVCSLSCIAFLWIGRMGMISVNSGNGGGGGSGTGGVDDT